MEVGLSWGEDHIGGVWFASLAEARSSEDVLALIAAAGRIQANTANLEDLARAFAAQRGLLILDNCEQVLGSCGSFVAAVLGAGGNLRILATSRSRLNVAGEEVWRLDPLPVPAPLSDDDDISRAALNGAVRLFVDRARSVDRTFVLSPKSLPALVELSRRLAGIPLAIELAARWVPALGIGEIASMLDPADPTATDPEGTEAAGSLRVAIEWGLSLLPPDDLSLLRDMAIFSGSFGLSDIAAVCAGGRTRAPLAAAVARVVDSSLLHATRQDGGVVRYHMLVPIREFLVVSRSEDWDNLEAAYAHHYLAKALTWQGDRFQDVVDLAPIDDDIDNLRAALDIGLVRGWADDVARALVPLNNYFFQRYLTWESKAWLERVVECDLSPSVEASALRALASSAEVLGDLSDAVDMFKRAITLFERAGDDIGKARCLVSLAGAYAHRGDWELGATTAQDSYNLMEASGNLAALAGSSYYIAENLTGSGDFAAAIPHFTRAAECFERCSEYGRGAYVMSRFALFAALDGDEPLAGAAVERATDLMVKSDSEYREAKVLGSAALVDAIWGDVRAAVSKLLRANERIEGVQRDRIFDFLLPAAAVFIRTGRWATVAELVVGVEQAVATTESAMPVLWTATMRRWVSQAVAGLGEEEDTIRRRNSAATIDTMTATTLAALHEIEAQVRDR
ncbi:putative HTH-type transcriptional regulator/MT0914 [bacterium BMS3Bbin02]|nr:putative HTH-type transcriptional regulator/MT0914 [bacterium BMS3Bbin02]